MNAYLIQEDVDGKVWLADTMQAALNDAWTDYLRQVQEEGGVTDEAAERAYYEESILHSCTLVGEVGEVRQVERTYFIHDTSRGYVGNCMVWWKHNNCGYTCDIGQARLFAESELPKYLEAGDLVAYPVDQIRAICTHHVDMQQLDRSKAIKQEALAT